MAFDASGFSTAQKSPRAGTCATPLLNVAGLWDPFLALVLRSHQYIHTLDGAADPFLFLQPTCGGKVPYWLTVATQFQQVPIFDKKKKPQKTKKKQKKKTEKKKNVKMSLNFHWLLFLYWSSCMFPASHRAIELSPCCCSLSFCHVPQIYQLWSLLSWIILFLFFFLICFKSAMPYQINVVLSRCTL